MRSGRREKQGGLTTDAMNVGKCAKLDLDVNVIFPNASAGSVDTGTLCVAMCSEKPAEFFWARADMLSAGWRADLMKSRRRVASNTKSDVGTSEIVQSVARQYTTSCVVFMTNRENRPTECYVVRFS